MEGCLDCGRGLHTFCQECECCNPSNQENVEGGRSDKGSNGSRRSQSSKKNSGVSKSFSSGDVGRPYKNSGDIKDKKSTGRKRAAILYPLFPDDACEWRNLANCGGGKFPIIGCTKGKQQHRHHGPNKNTLENSPGNVHRICDDCHNIWHSQNDKDYDPNIKHQPRPATLEELADRMMKIKYVADIRTS